MDNSGDVTLRSQGAAPPRATHGAPLVGRGVELAQLQASVRQILEGDPAFLAVRGEAGVGKTRLVQEALERVGHPTHWARSGSDGTDPPFWPLIQLVRSLRLRFGHETYARAVGSDSDLLLDPLASPTRAGSVALGELGRFQLFDRLLGVLRNLSELEPLVLVIDDVQWSDWSTLALVSLVCQAVTDLPVGMIVTVREDESITEPQAVRDLLGHMSVLRLSRLNRRHSATMLKNLVHVPVGDAYLDAAFEATGGNPHYLVEYASLVSPRDDVVISRLAGAATSRLDRAALLDGETLAVVQAGAVLGEAFELENVAAVSGMDPEVVLERLTGPSTRGLIAPRGQHRFGFVHGLNRESVYNSIEPEVRATLHMRAYEAIARSGRSVGDPLAATAFHLGRATLGVGDEGVLESLSGSAREADTAHAREEAVRRYELALAEADRLLALESGERVAHIESKRLELLLAQGAALAGLARHDEARRQLRSAADVARHLGDAKALARVALAFPPGLEMVAIAPEANPEQVALREEALRELPDGDSSLRAELMGALAVCRYWTAHLSGHPDRFDTSLQAQAELSGGGLEMARRLGDPRTTARCILHRLHAVWTPKYRNERTALGDELLDLAEELGDLDLLASGVGWKILAALDQGKIREVEALVATYSELADRLAQPLYRRNAHQWGACARVLKGDIEGGVQAMMGAMATTAAVIGDENAVTEAAMLLSVQRFFTGDYASLIEPARHVIASNLRTSLNWQTGLMFMLAESGELHEARALFDELTGDDNRVLPRDINWLVSTQLIALTAVRLQDRRRAEWLYRDLLEFEGVDVTHGWGYASYGPVGWALGELAIVLGNLEAAAEHLSQVVDTRESGPYRCVAELKLCQVMMELEPAGSLDVLRRVDKLAAMFRAWGAARFAAEAEGLLRSHSLAERSSGNVVARSDAGWRITADGLTGAGGVLTAGRGAQYLVELLSNPGTAIAAEELLAAATSGGSVRPRVGDDAVWGQGRLGEIIDSTARRAYERRLAYLRRQKKRAVRRSEPWRVDNYDAEIGQIQAELDASFAPGGRARLHSDQAERARVSVTKAIRRAITALYETSPALATHLELTVTTGTYCSYGPHPESRDWLVTSELSAR